MHALVRSNDSRKSNNRVRNLIPLGSGDVGAMIMAILPAAVPAVKELAAQL